MNGRCLKRFEEKNRAVFVRTNTKNCIGKPKNLVLYDAMKLSKHIATKLIPYHQTHQNESLDEMEVAYIF